MLLGADQRFWDVRYSRPAVQTVKVRHDSDELREHVYQKNGHVMVAARTLSGAIAATLREWPDAMIWSVVNHGREAGIIVTDGNSERSARTDNRDSAGTR